ncbi:MAG TPA: hypothetical protein VHC97_21555 [Thermoanaerobaculia bacterium]|nr:hypothetical protein [Thermoanaerobaculia bacterium]
MRKAVVFGGVLCLAAVSVLAGPQGAPFRVSSCTTCRQEMPAVAGSPSGSFLVLWQGMSAKDFRGINGRLFASTGAAAAVDFLVNKDVAPDQYDAAVARDAQGNFIAAWSEVANGNSEIMAQRFAATGAPLGSAFKVNVDAPGSVPADLKPSVAATKDGFVVVWLSLLPGSGNNPGTMPQVLARRFNTAGTPLGAQVQLSTGLVNDQRPDVCVDTSGRIITVWTSVDRFLPFEPSKEGISMRRLTAAGAPVAGVEVVVPPTANELRPTVACGAGSTFVVVWHGDLPPAVEGTDILGQRYSRLGRKVGPVFRLNTVTASNQRNPSVSYDSKGNFVAVWQGYTGSKYGVFGRRFTGAGAAAGPEFEVASDLHLKLEDPRVAHIGTAGNFVVVWQSPARAIFGQRFTP